MNAGRLRSEIELHALTLVDDGQGGYTEDWAPYATVAAEVTRTGTPSERIVGGVVTSVIQYAVRIRYRDDVEATQRIVTDGHTLEVLNVSEASRPRREQLILLCEATSQVAGD